MKTRFLFGCILLFCCFFHGLRAQDTEFWFVAPHTSEVSDGGVPLNRPTFLAISNSTFQTASVTITRYNGASASLVTNVTINPGDLYKLDFTTAADMKTIENPRGEAGSVTEFGMHIESDVLVTAYYMHNHANSKDIFTLKGRQALGTLFYTPMQSDNALATGSWAGACDQIDIVATADGTTVTVVPKAAIRIGASGSSAAGTSIIHTLHKGQTLKIMENTINSGSLAGTSITSDKPIAVTVTEDLVSPGDVSGDQIVPVVSLGTRYVVPRGYLDGHGYSAAHQERFYLVGTEAGTTVGIYATAGGSVPDQTFTLTAGDAARYTFPANTYAVYVESNKPVYVYQRTGYSEEGAALLPSVYSIQQTQMSFYQVGGSATQMPKGFLIFRTGMESGFTIRYGTASPVPLTLTPLDIPNVAEWKVARFDYAAPPSAGQVIQIESAQSAFALGYITVFSGSGSYGYFSAFGTFEFPAITYMCGTSVTIQGGYAKSYLWTFPDGSTATTSSIVATQEGEYTLVMDQDPKWITAKTTVQKVNAGVISLADTVICTGETPGTLTVSGASEPPGTTYQWQYSHDNVTWTNIPSATSPAYAPGPLSQTTWYRRGMTSDYCALAYTYAAKVRVSSCTLPVNPHLMIRYK